MFTLSINNCQDAATLERMRNLHKERKEKHFGEYDWDSLCWTGKLQRLKFQELIRKVLEFLQSLFKREIG